MKEKGGNAITANTPARKIITYGKINLILAAPNNLPRVSPDQRRAKRATIGMASGLLFSYINRAEMERAIKVYCLTHSSSLSNRSEYSVVPIVTAFGQWADSPEDNCVTAEKGRGNKLSINPIEHINWLYFVVDEVLATVTMFVGKNHWSWKCLSSRRLNKLGRQTWRY